MVKKALVLLAAIIIAIVAGRLLIRALASHETRLRWMVDDMVEAYNAGEAYDIGYYLAEDFVEGRHQIRRQTMILFLLRYFRERRHADGTFPLHAELIPLADKDPETPLRITVAGGEPPRATVELRVRFSGTPRAGGKDTSPPVSRLVGTLEFRTRCVLEDGRWKVLSAEHTVIEGERPF